MKIKYNILTIILLLLVNNYLDADDSASVINDSLCYEIIAHNNLNLGTIIKGQSKNINNGYTQNKIVFVVKCCDNEQIVIRRNRDMKVPGMEINAIWKMGPLSGEEEVFEDVNIVTPQNKQYFVTLTVNSIKMIGELDKGNYQFQPSITVERFLLKKN